MSPAKKNSIDAEMPWVKDSRMATSLAYLGLSTMTDSRKFI